jgi:hypothetical protein
VSASDEPTAAPQSGAQQSSSPGDDPVPGLRKLRQDLEGVLHPIANDAGLMDDSREDAHRMVQDIYRFANEKVFIANRLDPRRYEDSRRLFETVREEEDDAYYLYEGILEKQDKRWKLNHLTLDENRADLKVVAECRRQYIHTVQAFHTQVVTIEGYLSGRIAPPQQQAPGPG